MRPKKDSLAYTDRFYLRRSSCAPKRCTFKTFRYSCQASARRQRGSRMGSRPDASREEDTDARGGARRAEETEQTSSLRRRAGTSHKRGESPPKSSPLPSAQPVQDMLERLELVQCADCRPCSPTQPRDKVHPDMLEQCELLERLERLELLEQLVWRKIQDQTRNETPSPVGGR